VHLDIRNENAENRKALMHKRLRFYEQHVPTNVHTLSKYRAYAKRRKARVHIDVARDYIAELNCNL